MIVITGNEYIQIDTDSPSDLNCLANVTTEFRQAGWTQDHTMTLQVSASSENKKLIPPPLNPLWETRLKQIIIHNISSQQYNVTVSYFSNNVLMEIWKQPIQPGATRCLG